MKVIQVNCHYNYGSTGKIMYDISAYLDSLQIENIQCYSRGKKVKKKNVYKIANEYVCKIGKLINYVKGDPFSWGKYSTKKLISIIEQFNPDVVHLHCINVYSLNIYEILKYLKEKNIKTIVTLHVEFMYTGGCAYAFDCNQWKEYKGCKKCEDTRRCKAMVKNSAKNWEKMYDAFQGFKYNNLIIASVSPWLKERAAVSTILADYKHKVVLNGVDTDLFTLRSDEEISKVREKYNIGYKKVILHVTSDFDAPIKGGKYVKELSEMLINTGNKDYKIVVAGPCKRIENTENLQFLGVIKNQVELSILYSMAEVTVLTSEKETFSMICAESMCCGTKVVGFEAGAPETIAIKELSEFVKYGNIEELFDSMLNVLKEDKYEKAMTSSVAKSVYSKDLMSKNYLKLYEETLND